MQISAFIGRSGIALVVAMAFASAGGPAPASPFAGTTGAVDAGAPALERAAHKIKDWHWDGGWWKNGPWADHQIQGMVPTRPWPSAMFVPWGAERLRYCAATYRSFDPVTGTYVTYGGERRVCR